MLMTALSHPLAYGDDNMGCGMGQTVQRNRNQPSGLLRGMGILRKKEREVWVWAEKAGAILAVKARKPEAKGAYE